MQEVEGEEGGLVRTEDPMRVVESGGGWVSERLVTWRLLIVWLIASSQSSRLKGSWSYYQSKRSMYDS